MWTKKFWKDTIERMIRAAASSGVAFFTGSKVIMDLKTNWIALVGVMGTAALDSLFMSLAGGSGMVGNPGDPSLVK